MSHSKFAAYVFSRAFAAAVMTVTLSGPSIAAPAKMQAFVAHGIGGPDILKQETADTPMPGPGQVLVKIYAAGVNPVDYGRRTRQMGPDAPGTSVLGYDGAGVIDSVGPGVTEFKPGDKVYAIHAHGTGSFAEYAVAAVADVAPKPASLTFEEAASIPIAGSAGYRAALEAEMQNGQRIAIIGAAGGTGTIAVQFAKTKGAYVIAVGHSSQEAYLKSLGADEFVAYDKDNVADKIKDADAVLNLAGKADDALAYVKKGGRVVSLVGPPTPGKCEAAGVICYATFADQYKRQTQRQTLDDISALVAKGRYKITLQKVYPFAQTSEAVEAVHNGNNVGKIVVDVTAEAKSR